MTDRGTVKYSVVVPVYNSKGTLEELLKRIRAVFLEKKDSCEVIFVDDVSTDDSWAALKLLSESHDRVKIIQLARNVGQHGATLCGIRYAEGDYVITMDDDLQHAPEEIPRLAAALNEDVDVVFAMFDEHHDGLSRRLGSFIKHLCTRMIFRLRHDLQTSSFRIMRKNIAERLSESKSPHPYINGIILSITQRIGSVEVRKRQRKFGKSNYSPLKLAELLSNLVLPYSRIPIRLGVCVGMVLPVLGLVCGSLVMAEAILLQGQISWWSLVAVVASVFSGTVILLLGIIGEYAARILERLNQGPQYVVRESYNSGEYVTDHEEYTVEQGPQVR